MDLVKGAVAVWSADGTDTNTAVGIVLNKFRGFVRLRLLERKPDDDGDATHAYVMALPVDCFPVCECSNARVRVSAEHLGKEPEIERTDVVIHIPSKAFVARNRTTAAPLPAPGTLARVLRASSPTPASRCPAPFVLQESELCAAPVGVACLAPGTLGVFATEDLPKEYYAGELLGETGWDVQTFEDTGHRNVWPVWQKPTHSLKDGKRFARPTGGIADYIDSQDPDTSSFLRYINAALPREDTGRGNCEFVQMQDRVYLRTTEEVKAGKELLTPATSNPTPVGVRNAKASAVLSEPHAKRARVGEDEKKAAAEAKAVEAAKQRKKQQKKEKKKEEKKKRRRRRAAEAEREAGCAAAKKALTAPLLGGGGVCDLTATEGTPDNCLSAENRFANDQFVPQKVFANVTRQAKEALQRAHHLEAECAEMCRRAYFAEATLKRLGFTGRVWDTTCRS